MILLEILQANLEMELTGTGDNVLARLASEASARKDRTWRDA